MRLDLLLKLALAILLGGAIGLEREIAGKPAGLRTNILICIGAVLITDVSVTIGLGPNGVRYGDPARLAAQIVSGIGFIGAGTIMQTRGTVTGLTSAATIWVVAAIGIAIGAGRYIEATGAGALVTIVLAGLGTLEHKLRRARRVLSATLRTRPTVTREEIESLLGSSGIRIVGERIYDHQGEDRVFELKLSGPARQFDVVTEKLLGHEDIYGVHIG
ncbi:MAG TPA: MgtC/SapB family protein [Gemmatimonadaceae bacterium]|nr:MgtC/SapB family protein [Gemmatimonadaceae bacterium]